MANLSEELAKANELLERPDAGAELGAAEQAMLRKLTIEHLFAEAERRCEAEDAENLRKAQVLTAREQEHQRRMETEPAYRREMERRERSDKFRRAFGKLPKYHGPVPPALKS